jgi:probable HAF family extracellular repeat protein
MTNGQDSTDPKNFKTFDAVAGVTYTQAFAINNKDQIVGDYKDAKGVFHGFVTNGQDPTDPKNFTTIDYPGKGTAYTKAFGINDKGQVVGDYKDAGGVIHGFRFKGGDPTDIKNYDTVDVKGGTFGSADGINNAGQISGVYSDANGTHGFVVNDDLKTYVGGIPLDDPDAAKAPNAAIGPFGINTAATIVGAFIDGKGGNNGFVATLSSTPEPSTLILFSIGVLGSCSLARRRRKLAV